MLRRGGRSKPAFLASPVRPEDSPAHPMEMRPDPNWVNNPNIEWVYGRFMWAFYSALLILPAWILMQFFSAGASWSIVSFFHNVLTFIYLHWLKGNPFFYGQGKYDHLTFWEQLDGGHQYTYTRKFFIAVPLVLFLLSSHFTGYDLKLAFLNALTFVPVIVGKFASMHLVRLFGINSD